jgi:succinate-semialdehyde dehydrogenase/glutarate-semialdehyde dehydrogenase
MRLPSMSYRTINPATGALVQTFSKISDADLEIAIDGAYSCFQTDWRHRTVAERADTMRAAAAELLAHADDYAGYVTLEMGKLIRAARAEVSLSASILDHYATHADALRSSRRSRSASSSASSPGTSPTTRSRESPARSSWRATW